MMNKDLSFLEKIKLCNDLKVEEDEQGSALGSMGLKPKIVH